jgi:hypothetical protein
VVTSRLSRQVSLRAGRLRLLVMEPGAEAIIKGGRVCYNCEQVVKASKSVFVVDGQGFNEMRGRRIVTHGRASRDGRTTVEGGDAVVKGPRVKSSRGDEQDSRSMSQPSLRHNQIFLPWAWTPDVRV